MARTWFKVAGVTVFPRRDGDGPPSVLTCLQQEDPWRLQISWPQGFEGGIAHRLDTHTSGALWIADSLDELAEMREAFGAGRLVKRYRMLSAKDVPWDHNHCVQELAHDRRKRGKMIVRRGRNTPHRGKWYPAQTYFSSVGGRLWDIRMETGVTHQIRAHAAFLGLPILGDRLYGGGAPPESAPSGGFFLHHIGLRDESGWGTEAGPLPDWAIPVISPGSKGRDPRP